MENNWAELSPQEKREKRFQRWLSPPVIKFINQEAEKLYFERITRFARAFQVREPDRVPCILPVSNYPAYYAGTNLKTVMYDYEEMKRAWRKFLYDFEADTYMPPAFVPPGRALEAIDYKLYCWPGHGISGDTTSYQCVESEWMKADEYDVLIKDPSNFWLRTYIPRIFGALKGFPQLPPLTSIEEIATTIFIPFGLPDVQAGFQALMEAGNETLKWIAAVGEIANESMALGYPSIFSGMVKAPFDTIGDTLRGTRGIMMDMYQRPDKLHEAMGRMADLTIDNAITAANNGLAPIVSLPLHKGADTFMSVKQFKTFYWPTLKRVLLAMIDEGIVPLLFVEGSYNERLDIIKELPEGSVIWWFDQTDVFKAKEVLGDLHCILGNVPASLLITGTPEVKAHCRKLIEVCGKGGGYVLTGGAYVDRCNPDNLRAMMDATKEYGVYK